MAAYDDYTAEHWRQAFQCVSQDWTGFEPESPLEAAILKAYTSVGVIDGNEGVVAACVEAAAATWVSWEPAAFLDLARAFLCAYSDLDMLREQYLDENYPGTEVSWFKEDAPVWASVIAEDEILIEANGAVYIFAKPGSQQYEHLTKKEDR